MFTPNCFVEIFTQSFDAFQGNTKILNIKRKVVSTCRLFVGKDFFLHIYWCNLKQPVCSTGAILPTCHEMSIKCIKVHFTSQFSFHFLLMINLTFALGWVKRMRTAILLFLAGTIIYQTNGGKNLQNGISYRQSKKVTIMSFDTFTEKKLFLPAACGVVLKWVKFYLLLYLGHSPQLTSITLSPSTTLNTSTTLITRGHQIF